MSEMLIANDSLFLVVILVAISVIAAKDCWFTSNGGIRQFYCAAYQSCCSDHCCQISSKFYQLWYFWICVVILLIIFSAGVYLVHRWYKCKGTCAAQRSQRDPMTFVPTSTTSLPPPYTGIVEVDCFFPISPPAYNCTESVEPPSYNSLFETKIEPDEEGLLSSVSKD